MSDMAGYLVVSVEDSRRSPSLHSSHHQDIADGEKHEEELEDISPHHRLHATHRCVGHTDDEDGDTGNIHIDTGDLLEGEGW